MSGHSLTSRGAMAALFATLASCASEVSTTDSSVRNDGATDATRADIGAAADADDDVVAPDSSAVDVREDDASDGAAIDSGTPVDASIVDTGTRPDSGAAPDAMPETDECAGRAMACPTLTASAYPTGSGLRAIERCAYGLVDTGERAARDAIVRELETRLGRRTINDVIANTNRDGARVSSVAGMASFRQGFRWNAGDNAVDYWYPQGLTSSADAYASGRVAGRFVLVASWYYNTANAPAGDPIKGTRLAVVDATNLDAVSYRLVLLARPTRTSDGTPSFEPLLDGDGSDGLHAGGIVWWDHWLYVADTGGGFRVFDMNRVLEVPTDDERRVGYSATARAYGAFNYRYVIPEVARYRDAPGSCTSFNYSFVGLDRSTTPPTLVAGEYVASSPIGRLVRYRIDVSTGELYRRAGIARPTEAWVSAEQNNQGAFSRNGQWWLSSTGAMRALHRTRPGAASVEYAWPYGCEDLTYDPTTGLLWTLTEHPDQRYVAASALSGLGG